MKGLAGGLLTDARVCRAFMSQYDNVVPIWGIQTAEELAQWLAVTAEDPQMDEPTWAIIRRDRKELAGSFCRGCGYCMHIADLGADMNVLQTAQDAAKALLSADPELSDPAHAALRERVQRLFESNADTFN